MNNTISLSVVLEPNQMGSGLSLLAGRWGTGLDVTLTNPTEVTYASVKQISLGPYTIEWLQKKYDGYHIPKIPQ